MKQEGKPIRKTIWLVIVKGPCPVRNLVVASTKQKAKELAKGVGYKYVEFIAETDTYKEDKLIIYF